MRILKHNYTVNERDYILELLNNSTYLRDAATPSVNPHLHKET